MRRDEAVTDARQFLDVLAQFGGAKCAVEAEGYRPDMAERIPERFGGLTGKRAARGVGDRAGYHDRPASSGLFEELLDREKRRFGVERIEDRFHQQNVGAAIDQTANGFTVRFNQLVKAGVAIARIVHIG